MHEASLAKNVIDIIENYRDNIDNRRVISITLRVGELMGIYPDSLQFYFNELSKGTVADGASLAFEECPIRGKCRNCDNEFELKNFEYNCPKCNDSKFDILGGNEFEIVNIEVE